MIGYPLGTPMKLAKNARVIFNNEEAQSFITNLDAFEGNSGSPVFNEKNEVSGILVNGTPMSSFIKDTGRSCSFYNHCDESGKECKVADSSYLPGFQATGSGVQRIRAILDLLP